VVSEAADRRIGFPVGDAERLVLQSFRSFPLRDASGAALHHGPAHEVREHLRQIEASLSPAKSPPPPRAGRSRAPATGTPASRAPTAASTPPPAPTPPRTTDSGKQVPVDNGGIGPGYTWTQSLTDVSVTLPLPPGTHAADVECALEPRRVRVKLRASDEPLLDGPLHLEINPGESSWTLSPGEVAGAETVLSLSLEKGLETWWECVVEGHPRVDTTLVDSRRDLADYDPETQAEIRRIVHQQRLAAAGGSPAAAGGGSAAEDMEAILERARGAPGSPFQPPS